LLGEREVEPAVAVHVSGGDAAADHRLAEADERADVVVAAVVAADEERIEVVAAQVGAGFEVWPEPGVMDHLIVAGSKGLEFGPAVDFSLDETDGLDGFEHAVVVE